MMQLHGIFSVEEDVEPGVYFVDADLTDINGNRYRATYVSRDGDLIGLGPDVWTAVQDWIEQGKPVGTRAIIETTPSPIEILRAQVDELKAQLAAQS